MAAKLSLAEQLKALVGHLENTVSKLKTVVGLEELQKALQLAAPLPAAVVIYMGDFPKKGRKDVEAEHSGQKLMRIWSVILVLELQDDPGLALDLIEDVNNTGVGYRPCIGVGLLQAAGSRFVTTFDETRVVYEVRFRVTALN